MGDHQYGLPVMAGCFQKQIHHILAVFRIQISCGLVGQHQHGSGDERSAVIRDGVLPRKTFSMGEAHDKRFYLEARRIRE